MHMLVAGKSYRLHILIKWTSDTQNLPNVRKWRLQSCIPKII